MSDGRYIASARTIRRISFFSNLFLVSSIWVLRWKEGKVGKKNTTTKEYVSEGFWCRSGDHIPRRQVFHEKMIPFRIVIWCRHAINDTLELRITGWRPEQVCCGGRDWYWMWGHAGIRGWWQWVVTESAEYRRLRSRIQRISRLKRMKRIRHLGRFFRSLRRSIGIREKIGWVTEKDVYEPY